MSSRSQSLPDLSNSAVSEFNSLVYPSKIFDIRRFSDRLDLRHNCSIAALTDPARLAYTHRIDEVINVLSDPDIATYQDRLLGEAIQGICADRVDIDYLEIGIKLTLTDFEKLIANVSDASKTEPPEKKSAAITKVRTKERQTRLKVQQVPLGTKNSFYKKNDKKPFFTQKYRLIVDSDSYRFLDIYLADPANKRNQKPLDYNCTVEFIPTRLTPALISFMLYQLQSVLGPRRYQQLLDNALLLRIDTGYIMHGVSQLFCFALRAKDKVTVGSCIPDNKSVVETTYIGERKKSQYHDIVYDKVLKEIKLFVLDVLSVLHCDFGKIADYIDGIDQLFQQNAASARLETRQFLKRKKAIPLREINEVDPLIHRVMFLRPSVIKDLDDHRLKELISDKAIQKVSAVRSALAKQYRYKSKKYVYKFDVPQVKAAFKPVLESMKAAIYNPVKLLEENPLGNYQAAVLSARKYLAPLVHERRHKQSPLSKIIKSRKCCIYVEGSPGSGKTEVIVKRVEHLLKSDRSPSKICVLAFTNDAAKEFAGRLAKAKILKDGMFVGTFSAWCNQYLNKVDTATILDQVKSLEAIEQCIPSKIGLCKHFEKQDIARYVFRILSHSVNFGERDYDKCIAKLVPFLTPFCSDIKKIIKSYVVWKRRNSKRDFNDLLRKMADLLKQAKGEKNLNEISIPEYILLDEAQDTNDIQFEVLDYLDSMGCQLFFVGDPAQSMYGFRGAKNFNHKRLKRVFHDCQHFQLVNNKRSKSPIVNLANYLRFCINRNYSPSIAKRKGTLLPKYAQFSNINEAIAYVVRDLESFEDIPDGFVLILCRYNVHVKLVEKELEKLKERRPDLCLPKDVCMTYHKSKGREAEHCYVFDPTFSNYSLGTRKEELCNTYVAFTRAKSNLMILASQMGQAMYGTTEKREVQMSIFSSLRKELIEFIDYSS